MINAAVIEQKKIMVKKKDTIIGRDSDGINGNVKKREFDP